MDLLGLNHDFLLVFLGLGLILGDWIDDKIESWVANSDSIDDEKREFLV